MPAALRHPPVRDHYGQGMANRSAQKTDSTEESKAGLWGFLAGIIVAAFVAVPASAAVAFATHPHTSQLFAGRLSETSTGGYQAFWWFVALLLIAMPFLVGYAVAKLSSRTLAIVGGIIAVLIIVVFILGQVFVF